MLNLHRTKSIATLGAAFLVLALSGCAHQKQQAPEEKTATPAVTPATPGLELESNPALSNVSFIEGDVAGNRLKLYKIRPTENDKPVPSPATPGIELQSNPALSNVSFIDGDVAGNRLKLYKIRSTENDRPVYCQQYLKSIVKNEKTGDYDIELASFCDGEKK